jgi:hypothetical protein
LGLRQARAGLRQQELIIARDRANLAQGMHAAVHLVALSYRNLSQFYAQYLAFREARTAARINLERQLADYRAGRRTLLINVLQAITDWGNAVSFESQALTRYNVELANLERQTGTILETHGVRFQEERFRSIGPFGRLCDARMYPRDHRPGPNQPRYRVGNRPSEQGFGLEPIGLQPGPELPEMDLEQPAPNIELLPPP